jgi:hypothetical protein
MLDFPPKRVRDAHLIGALHHPDPFSYWACDVAHTQAVLKTFVGRTVVDLGNVLGVQISANY